MKHLDKNFILLLLSELFTVFGDVFFYTAITWMTLSQSNSTFVISLLDTVDMLPALLFVLFISVQIDRLGNQKKMLMTIYLMQGFVTIVLWIFLIIYGANLYIILLGIFVNSLVASGKNPVVYKIIVSIDKKQMAKKKYIAYNREKSSYYFC